MKKYFCLITLSFFLSMAFWSCIEDEPDLDPDWLVHSAYLSYSGDVYFYGPLGNTDGIGMKMWSGVGVSWNLINCEIVGTGPIVQASDEKIEIQNTHNESSMTINPRQIKDDIGYIYRGDLVYGPNKKVKSFYFYVYFTDFSSAPNVGLYNPRVVHYQRFK